MDVIFYFNIRTYPDRTTSNYRFYKYQDIFCETAYLGFVVLYLLGTSESQYKKLMV